MPRYVVLGNSGSGKSTLAARLATSLHLAHLDLDTLAWLPTTPPSRRPLEDSVRALEALLDANEDWVVEGCYADLARAALPRRPRLVFLNPGVEACVANARARPWEQHKYASREAQDENLNMLIGWIREYATRDDDVFSLAAHRALFEGFHGDKIELASREAITAFAG